jgi:hypothetical protein
VFPFVAFVVYDVVISRQQKRILKTAQRSDAIISDLFPSNVREKLYLQDMNQQSGENGNGAPIADLHPETTVLFAGKAETREYSHCSQLILHGLTICCIGIRYCRIHFVVFWYVYLLGLCRVDIYFGLILFLVCIAFHSPGPLSSIHLIGRNLWKV